MQTHEYRACLVPGLKTKTHEPKIHKATHTQSAHGKTRLRSVARSHDRIEVNAPSFAIVVEAIHPIDAGTLVVSAKQVYLFSCVSVFCVGPADVHRVPCMCGWVMHGINAWYYTFGAMECGVRSTAWNKGIRTLRTPSLVNADMCA